MPFRENIIIPNVDAGAQPTILRSRLHHAVIHQVNTNSVALAPPRMVDQGRDRAGQALLGQYQAQTAEPNVVDGAAVDAPILTEQITLSELRRQTSEVRVFDPEDETVYVDVERIDSVLMVGSDGKTYILDFDNGAT